ncbi:hypothetical protein K439DRAFT_1630140 [Ramaria rubella]|nr:hypothetical protein K439DRAFT_1630140 [Ramaria rubella]
MGILKLRGLIYTMIYGTIGCGIPHSHTSCFPGHVLKTTGVSLASIAIAKVTTEIAVTVDTAALSNTPSYTHVTINAGPDETAYF